MGADEVFLQSLREHFKACGVRFKWPKPKKKEVRPIDQERAEQLEEETKKENGGSAWIFWSFLEASKYVAALAFIVFVIWAVAKISERGDFSDHGSSAFSDPVSAGDPCYNAFDAREYAKSKTMNSILGIDGLFGNMLAESAAEREGRRKCKEVRR